MRATGQEQPAGKVPPATTAMSWLPVVARKSSLNSSFLISWPAGTRPVQTCFSKVPFNRLTPTRTMLALPLVAGLAFGLVGSRVHLAVICRLKAHDSQQSETVVKTSSLLNIGRRRLLHRGKSTGAVGITRPWIRRSGHRLKQRAAVT